MQNQWILYLVRLVPLLIISFVAGFFGRFLGKERITTEFRLFFLVIIVGLILFYRRSRNQKGSFFLLFIIYLILFLFSAFFRIFLLDHVVALVGSAFIFNVSSGSSSGGGSAALESSSSSGTADSSTSTTMIVGSSHTNSIAVGQENPRADPPLLSNFHVDFDYPELAEQEIELYARIRLLEARQIEGLPPQLNLGEYERLVGGFLNETITIDHYSSTLSNELFDVTILELKADIQDSLFNLFLNHYLES